MIDVCNLFQARVLELLVYEDQSVFSLLAGETLVFLLESPLLRMQGLEIAIFLRVLIERKFWIVKFPCEHKLVKDVTITLSNAGRDFSLVN